MKARRCAKGHAVKGGNVVLKESRGRPFKRCRKCVNAYQKRLMRRRRRKGLA